MLNLCINTEKTNKPSSNSYHIIKRIIDICFSFVGIILMIPAYFIIFVIVLITDKTFPIFIHKRVGKGGKEIKIIKFKSMVNKSFDSLTLNDQQTKEWNEKYKLAEDPRITKVGKFLRKTYLDEFPQLFNVFIGDISIVGPRPITKSEIDKYWKGYEDILLKIKPGLTGYWQAYSKDNCSYTERVEMEKAYIASESFLFDLKIFIHTIKKFLISFRF